MDTKRRGVIQMLMATGAFLAGKPVYAQKPDPTLPLDNRVPGYIVEVQRAHHMRLYLGDGAGMIDEFEIIYGNRKVTLTAAEIMDALEGK